MATKKKNVKKQENDFVGFGEMDKIIRKSADDVKITTNIDLQSLVEKLYKLRDCDFDLDNNITLKEFVQDCICLSYVHETTANLFLSDRHDSDKKLNNKITLAKQGRFSIVYHTEDGYATSNTFHEHLAYVMIEAARIYLDTLDKEIRKSF